MSARRWVPLLVLLLAGCTVPAQKHEEENPPASTQAPEEERVTPAPAPPPEVRMPSEQERALSYFDRLRRMSAAELAREQEGLRQAYAQSRSDFDRMRLAMSYALPNTPFSDEGRVLELLEPLIRNITAELHPLAVLVVVFAQEQKRLSANIQTLQQGVQSLQQKLDALRSLERSMIEREGGAARRK